MAIQQHFTSSPEFVEAYEAAVLQIRSAPAGQLMMAALERSDGPVVTIRRQPKNTCGLSTNTLEEAAKASYVESRSNEALLAVLHKLVNGDLCDSAAVQDALRKGAAQVVSGGQAAPRKVLPNGVWTKLQRGKVAYHLRAHLTPGDGAAATVTWNPTGESASQGELVPPPAWDARPPWIALAHELIHAWHDVTGRVVFDLSDPECSMYEEYMTVGIPPYDGEACTENLFRRLHKVNVRHYYGSTTKEKSEKAWKKYPRD